MSRLVGILFWSFAALVWLVLAFVLGWSAVLVALCCAGMACAVATGCVPVELLRVTLALAGFSILYDVVAPTYTKLSPEAVNWVAAVWVLFFLLVHWVSGKLLRRKA